MINTETFRTQYITNMTPTLKLSSAHHINLDIYIIIQLKGNQTLFLTIITHSLLQL